MSRVLFVSQTGQLGGAELVLLSVAAHMKDRCQVLLLGDGPLRGRLEQAGVATTVLPGGRSLTGVSRRGHGLRALAAGPEVVRLAWQVAKLARGFDVVYANSQKAAAVAMPAALAARRPLVWHLHDILSPEHFAGLQRRAVIGLARVAARRVIAISQAVRDGYVAAGGAPEQVQVVLNGLDAAPFDRVVPADVAALRRSLGLEGRQVVGLFGRLCAWKGHHVLLDALPGLPGVHALMVGDALFGEADHKAALLRRCAELGVADRVHWLGFRDDVPLLMRSVDIVLHTSVLAEPFGRVICEGMLAGTPVLATSLGGAIELLGEHSDALVPADDPAALALAVRRTLARPDAEQARIVAENRRRAEEMFSLHGMLAGIERVLVSLPGRQVAGPAAHPPRPGPAGARAVSR